jgi:hypothetical protein
VSAANVTLRLARRMAWRERWTILLAAFFVSLAVAAGLSVFAAGSRGADTARFRFAIAGTPGVADGAPAPLATAPGRVVVSGNGSGYVFDLHRPEVDVNATKAPAKATAATAPAGSRAVAFLALAERLLGRERVAVVSLEDLDLHAAHASLETRLTDGRAPRAAGEIALEAGLARDLRVHLGDRVSVVGGRGATVVGLVADAGGGELSTGSPVAIVPPGSLDGTGAARVWRIDVPGSKAPATRNLGASQGAATSPVDGSPTPEALGALSYSFEGAGGVHGGVAAGAAIALYLLVYQSFLLLLPLFLAIAILAIGGARRGAELRLLTLQGARETALRGLATVRGLIVAVVAVGLAMVEIVVLDRVAGTHVDLATWWVLAPALPATIGCVVASNVALRTARRIEGGLDRPALPSELRRSVAIGGAAILAAASAIALLGTVGDRLPGIARPLVAMALVGLAVTGIAKLAVVAIALPGLMPLPGASRAALRAVSRARWVSAPAAVAVALASALLLLVGAGTSSSSSGGDTGPTADPAIVGIDAQARSDVGGNLVAPREVVARLVPTGSVLVQVGSIDSALGPVQVISSADATTLGLDLSASSARTVVDVCTTAYGGDGAGWTVVRAPRPGWPTSRGCLFTTVGAPDARQAPKWIVRLPAAPTTDQLHGIAVAARNEGLVLTTDGNDPLQDPNGGNLATGVVGLVTAGLVLVFCSVATALVLAERREETRRLALAGARLRDLRLAAAASALGFGIAAFLLTLVLVALMMLAASFGGGFGDLVARLPATLGPSIAVPFIVAAGAALLTRAPRPGRLGRTPRRAAPGR